MRVKLFTFRYSATLGGFDDSPLSGFVRDKEVVSFREHFFCVNDVPHLTCVLVWQEAVVPADDLEAARSLPPARKPVAREPTGKRDDPTAGLSEPERVLFNTLRDWRSKKAQEEGVPPYLVFTNRHFLEIVRKRPGSPTALSNLSGIGAGKVERYGAEVLALVGPTEPRSPGESAPEATAEARA